MVGEEAGLGGRLIRTVSFFGCTFAASPGLGGSAPPGTGGMFSAIIVTCWRQTRFGLSSCQTLTCPAILSEPQKATHPARIKSH